MLQGVKIAGISLLALGIVVSSSINAQAEDVSDFATERIENEIASLNQKYESEVTISISDTEMSEEYAEMISGMDDEQLHQYLESFYTDAIDLYDTPIAIPEESMPSMAPVSRAASAGTWTEYTTVSKECSVSSAIPSIGICWIKIPYTASMKKMEGTGSWYIDSVSVGTSYQTGIAVASWSHTSSNVEKAQYETYANVYVTGVLSYSIPKTPLSVQSSETFVYLLSSTEIME